ncbi:SCO family protein [Acidiphilium sp.]|uniref:SCO family protein n=1 Tax=Acidiphilium sp. TaxID=527 RepID=UPI0025891448|nr:SCO family protein [Acidiphilium sp.]
MSENAKRSIPWRRALRSAGIGIDAVLAVAATIIIIDPGLVGITEYGVLRAMFGPRHHDRMATTTKSNIPKGAPLGGPFTLTNQFGQTVTAASYRGKWMLVYFGYSHCPDECPLTLEKMTIMMNALGPIAKHVAPIFITIDPARDKPPVLKKYLSKFGPDLIGLTGTSAEIAKVAHEYAVYYDANQHEKSGTSVIGHSTFIYLMSPDGKFDNLFPVNITVPQLVQVVRKAVADG